MKDPTPPAQPSASREKVIEKLAKKHSREMFGDTKQQPGCEVAMIAFGTELAAALSELAGGDAGNDEAEKTALSLFSKMPRRSGSAIAWNNAASDMCKFCIGDEDVTEAALRIIYNTQQSQLATLTRERDEATAGHDRAVRSERNLRDEISAAFRKHGLAAGPEAVDALVRERDALTAENLALRAQLDELKAALTSQIESANKWEDDCIAAQAENLALRGQMEKGKSSREYFEDGYICAVANMLKQHGETTIAKDCLDGVGPDSIDWARIDAFDVEELRKAGLISAPQPKQEKNDE